MRVRIPLAVAFMFLSVSGLAVAQTSADAKIDRGLINTLINSQDGTAPFFVIFGERTSLAAAYGIQDWAARGRFVVGSLQATANRSQNGVRGYLQAQGVAFTPFWIENKIYVPSGTMDLARALARRPDVAAILPEEIYTIPPPQISANAIEAVGWNINLIGADAVWLTYTNKGTGIVVANIDTGVQFNHPALVNQYRGNLGGGSFNHSGNFYDAASADPNPLYRCGTAPCDKNGHGTHTMGTMVGDDGAGNQIGVAPGARWIACRACTTSSCPDSYLTACAQWIAAPAGDPALRPNVVNNSWGGGSGDAWYRTYVQNWVAAGIFPAFSIGNSGPACKTAGSPGDYPESFASGATDLIDNIASFSSRGPSAFGGVKPNVSAPGVNVRSSVPTNSYALYSGTSMASPHTAGTVALLWAIRPSYVGQISSTESLLTANAARRAASETCGGVPGGAIPNNTYGHGRIDAKGTVDAASGGPINQPPTVTIDTPNSDGQQFNCNTVVNFAATASDPEDGNLTSVIQWSGAGFPSAPTGSLVTKTFDCGTELSNQVITARVTDSGGLSATGTVTVLIVNPDGPPAAPSSLGATASGSNVILNWIDNATNEDGFKVYRRQKSGNKWSTWAVKATISTASTQTYTDLNVPKGTFQYYVTAYKGISDESAASNIVQVKK